MAKKINYGFFILILILIILPLGSWYYLQKGTEYRMELLNDFGDYGKLPAFSLTDMKGEIVDNKSLAKKIVIANFFSEKQPESNRQKAEMLVKLYEQFDERKDVIFLTFYPESEKGTPALQAYIDQYGFGEQSQWKFAAGDETVLSRMGNENFKISGDVFTATQIAITDIDHMIKRQYDMTKPAEVSRCVEHLAILLPVVKKRSPKTK